jgi:hypothetical protein
VEPLDVAIVALIFVGWWVMNWVDEKDLLAIGLHRLRVRLGRQVPVGRHRIEDGVSVRVGRPDTILVFKLPLPSSGAQRPTRYVGVTDESTRFTVGDAVVTLDEFLEAYDDGPRPFDVQVYEAGKILSIGIDTGEPSHPTRVVP